MRIAAMPPRPPADDAGAGDGEGLPAFFTRYVGGGRAMARGEPVRGEIVSPAGGY